MSKTRRLALGFIVVCLLTVQSVPCRADVFSALLGLQALQLAHQGRTLSSNENILIQTSEFTCGPAALASLLKFYFGEDTDEKEIATLSHTYEQKTTALSGLRDACQSKGYSAVGYRMTFPQLMQEVETSHVPVLVHFREPSLHFSLVTGRVGEFVLVSDPSRGNISMDITDFMRRFDGKVLVVKSKRPVKSSIMDERTKSARVRVDSLRRASSLMSSPGR